MRNTLAVIGIIAGISQTVGGAILVWIIAVLLLAEFVYTLRATPHTDDSKSGVKVR